MFDIKNLMQQAKDMQENVKKAQAELKNMTFTGDVSNGTLQITINGVKEVVSVKMKEEIKNEDTQVLEDLIMATFNDALNKCSKTSKEKISNVTGNLGINLPDELI